MKKTITLLYIFLHLTACSQASFKPTSSPTIRVFLPKVTEAPRQTPGPTRTPRATFTPVPTPMLASPLDASGPWLLHKIPINGDRNYYRLAITNFDGSGYLEIDPPLNTVSYHYAITPPNSQAGALLAIRVIESRIFSLGDTDQPSEIWIIRIPEGEIIRKIPLLGDGVKSIVAKHTPEPIFGISGVDSGITMAPFEWSPNGRYLAFSAAIDGPSADLYIYNSSNDSIRRLTDGPHQAVFTAWSPGSRWIVHEAAEYYHQPWRPVISTWATSIDGQITKLENGPENLDRISGWITGTSMVVYDVAFEAASRNLRTINLLTGESRILFEGPFYRAAYDPLTNTQLINMQAIMVAPPTDDAIGIYQLDQTTKKIEMLIPGRTLWLNWEENFMQFSGFNIDNESTLIFNALGEITCNIPKYENEFLFAPNGNYFLVTNFNSHILFTENCTTLLTIDGPGSLLWLSDSSGFIHHTEDKFETHPIYLHSLENDWLPVLLNPNAAIPGFDAVIYP